MIKINLSEDIEEYFLKEIACFFARSRSGISYKEASRITYRSLGISLKELLVMKPEQLLNVAGNISLNTPANFSEDKTKFISFYKKFRTSIGSKNYIEKVNLKVCPYCNRNYIFNFKKKNTKHASAQLDHFLDKDRYPYFTLCMYNLIPCCNTCNHRKSIKDVLAEPIFNPYEDNIHNHIYFTSYEILSLSSFNDESLALTSEERIRVGIEVKSDDPKIKEHLSTFNVEALYNNHKDIVSELYQKYLIYPKSRIDELFEEYGGIVFDDRDELLRLITCAYVDDKSLNKRPLSKFTRDISEELGFFSQT